MTKISPKRGVIPIALAFVMVACIVVVSMTNILWSKAPITVNQTRRFQIRALAEAALCEAFNRFRQKGTYDATVWDIDNWADGQNRDITIDGIIVNIRVTKPIIGGTQKNRISARINYSQIRL